MTDRSPSYDELLDREREARMRVEKARHEIRLQRGTGVWNLGNIEHILKHDGTD